MGFFLFLRLQKHEHTTLQVSASRQDGTSSVSVKVFGALMGNSKERGGNGSVENS